MSHLVAVMSHLVAVAPEADSSRRIREESASDHFREEFARKELSEVRKYIPAETRGCEGLPLMNSDVNGLITRRS